nr:MAG TPA: hypothetical protein [Caudoviricetes sp.]DAL45720.1 MAG TPA_asm: hypothetical protein [Caudoviricetes sp.]
MRSANSKCSFLRFHRLIQSQTLELTSIATNRPTISFILQPP